MLNELKQLNNPLKYKKIISLEKLKKPKLKDLLTKMLLIRNVENKVANLVEKKIINCPAHLWTGQEAVSVGILSNCKKGDMVYGNHRSHGHPLAKGGDVNKAMAEIFGKQDGKNLYRWTEC